MKRKLIRVGTSAAIIIPKSILDEQGVKIGDTVHVEVSKKELIPKKGVNPDIYEQTERFRKRYQSLLKRLASS